MGWVQPFLVGAQVERPVGSHGLSLFMWRWFWLRGWRLRATQMQDQHPDDEHFQDDHTQDKAVLGITEHPSVQIDRAQDDGED